MSISLGMCESVIKSQMDSIQVHAYRWDQEFKMAQQDIYLITSTFSKLKFHEGQSCFYTTKEPEKKERKRGCDCCAII